MTVASLLLPFLLLSPSDERVESDFGFALDVPEGWSTRDVDRTETSLHLLIGPTGAPPGTQLTLQVKPADGYGSVAAVYETARASVDGNDQYENFESFEVELLGRELPSLRVDLESGGVRYTLQQSYLIEGGNLYILQSSAPVADFDDYLEDFERVWESLRLVEPSEERRQRNSLRRLAERCGSELAWAATWEEAAERARAERKLVLVRIRRYAGFQLTDELLRSAFMEPEIVALVNERYVPLRLDDLDVPFADHDVYGLSASTFGETLLLVTPEGQVVLDQHAPIEDFLIEGLTARAEYAGPPLPEVNDRLEAAHSHARRGELERARALLAGLEDARAYRLVAQLDRRALRGEEGLAAVACARRAPGAAELEVDLDVDEALLRMRTGDHVRARGLLEGVVREHPDHQRVSEALYRLGALRWELDGREAAEATWRELIERQPEDRWAWRAAGILTSTTWTAERRARLTWPPAALWASQTIPPAEPLGSDDMPRAVADAVRYLVEHQLPDGSWPVPTDAGRTDDLPPHDFTLATAAICGRALLAHVEDEASDEAVQRALAWTLHAYDTLRAAGEEVLFMDYSVWSRAFALLFLTDCVDEGVAKLEDLRPYAERMLTELEEKAKPSGGWSYYVTQDLESTSSPQNQAMTFTTAAVCLAILRSLEVGFGEPDELLAGGLDLLEALRSEDGIFAYMGIPGAQAVQVSAPGAAGRGPICAWTLLRTGRAELDDVRAALSRFVAHADGLASEQGKRLMHTGGDTQGSHYLLFDYAFAAAAVRSLPTDERVRFAPTVLEKVLAARLAGGGFVDNPLLGVACGTGLALLALDALRPGP